jgi:hypothetical protein
MWEDADCKAYGCDREANPAIEALPLCHHHALQIATLYEAIVVANYLERTEEQAEHKVEVKAAKRGNREPSVVYYARIGDYIKIGYTTRLRDRLNTLRVDGLLAIEPGNADLERARHHQFSLDRIDLRRENFRPSPALESHIAFLREHHPLPHWATRPRTSRIIRREQGTPA